MLETQLQPGEHVIKVVRKHPLILVAQLLPFALLDYLPYLVPKLGEFLSAQTPNSIIPWETLLSFSNPWMTFIVGIYWIFVWMGAVGVFIDYYLDQWVVTSERLIDINQSGFWARDVAILQMIKVENVQTDTTGLLNTIFGFGTVNVETAGAQEDRFEMSGLSHSLELRDLLMRIGTECRDREAKRHNEAKD